MSTLYTFFDNMTPYGTASGLMNSATKRALRSWGFKLVRGSGFGGVGPWVSGLGCCAGA